MSEAGLVDRIAVLEWDVRVLKERLESLEAKRETKLPIGTLLSYAGEQAPPGWRKWEQDKNFIIKEG